MSHYLIQDGARRVMNEYLDLPGLSLTAPQAQRLFALDGLVCEGILGTLVDLQFLRQTREGRYVRRVPGRVGRRLPADPYLLGAGNIVTQPDAA